MLILVSFLIPSGHLNQIITSPLDRKIFSSSDTTVRYSDNFKQKAKSDSSFKRPFPVIWAKATMTEYPWVLHMTSDARARSPTFSDAIVEVYNA